MIAALGISGLLLGLTTQSPVDVASCKINPPSSYQSTPDSAVETNRTYTVTVKFANDTERTLKRVRFELNNGSTFVDAGTFSPGVSIDHTFLLSRDDASASACSVASATFANGTRWKP